MNTSRLFEKILKENTVDNLLDEINSFVENAYEDEISDLTCVAIGNAFLSVYDGYSEDEVFEALAFAHESNCYFWSESWDGTDDNEDDPFFDDDEDN